MIIQTNLLPEELRKKERIRLLLPNVPLRKALTAFFGIFFMIQVALSGFAFYQKGRLGQVEKQTVALKAQNKEVALRKAEITSAKARSNEIASLIRRDFFWTKLLNDLSDSVTKGIWLTGLSIEDQVGPSVTNAKGRKVAGLKTKILSLGGSAVGQGQETATIGKFIKELKDHPSLSEIFQDVKLQNINQKRVRDADVYDFTLTCLFKPEQGK